jgi:dTDP-4-amino-4,6-dideoxygalactose transaminase
MALHTPYFDKNDVSYLRKCIKSTFVSTQAGYYIDKFKSKLIDITGSKYIVLLNSGSSGIYLGLRTLDVKENE